MLYTLCFLSAAISNAKYANDNNKLYDKYKCERANLDICNDLEKVSNAQATAAVSSHV